MEDNTRVKYQDVIIMGPSRRWLPHHLHSHLNVFFSYATHLRSFHHILPPSGLLYSVSQCSTCPWKYSLLLYGFPILSLRIYLYLTSYRKKNPMGPQEITTAKIPVCLLFVCFKRITLTSSFASFKAHVIC